MQFRLIDTAGIREASDQIEAIGVQKTLEEVKKSSILVYVYDMMGLNPSEVKKDLEKLDREGLKIIVIANKYDKYLNLDDNLRISRDKQYLENNWYATEKLLKQKFTYIELSAKDKTQLESLYNALFELVASGTISHNNTIVSNSRHYTALQTATESLDSVMNGLSIGITGDFLAMDIRHALNALGEITGEISTDDLLGNIFSKFCIGK